MIKNPMSDTKILSEKMTGFYRGVVEDNNDPDKAGRLRARIWGLHTEQKIKDTLEGIPTDELPWAEPCFGLTEGSISGFGMWSIPLQGSHVMMFFENGNLAQPRYFATLPGIPESKLSLDVNDPNLHEVQAIGANSSDESPSKMGFQDPDGQYPKDDRLGEPDVNRLARGVSSGTSVETKNSNRDLGVSEAGGGTWDEPVSPYAAQYPHNLVLSTHGGLTLEMDSTPGAARLNFYHPSNSYMEIDNNGVMVIKNTDKKYEIIISDNNIHIQGDKSETINGDDKLKVGGNVISEVGGNVTEEVTGNVTEEVTGNVTEEIGGNLTVTVGGNITITASGNVTVTSPSTTITGGSVSLASQTTMKAMMNELMIALYNSHQHNYTDTGGGAGTQPTTPPINNTLSLSQATLNTRAS